MEKPLWRMKPKRQSEKRQPGSKGLRERGRRLVVWGWAHTLQKDSIIDGTVKDVTALTPALCTLWKRGLLPPCISRAGDRRQSNTIWLTRPHHRRRQSFQVSLLWHLWSSKPQPAVLHGIPDRLAHEYIFGPQFQRNCQTHSSFGRLQVPGPVSLTFACCW